MKALEMVVLDLHGTMTPAWVVGSYTAGSLLGITTMDLETDSRLYFLFLKVESVSLAVAESVLM